MIKTPLPLLRLSPSLDPVLPPELRLLVTDLAPAAEVARLGPFPVALERVPAGFPNPTVTGGHVGHTIDLHELVGGNEPSCYFMRVQGERMVGAGIHEGDVCVVNRATEPRTGEIVVAVLDGEMTVKRFVTDGRGPRLLAENPDSPPIWIERHQEAEVWGVVVFSLRDHRVGRAVKRAARAAWSSGCVSLALEFARRRAGWIRLSPDRDGRGPASPARRNPRACPGGASPVARP